MAIQVGVRAPPVSPLQAGVLLTTLELVADRAEALHRAADQLGEQEVGTTK